MGLASDLRRHKRGVFESAFQCFACASLFRVRRDIDHWRGKEGGFGPVKQTPYLPGALSPFWIPLAASDIWAKTVKFFNTGDNFFVV